ncbi:hypothetical protein FQA47_017773 [Oryzias melastigma]|uniref:Uncharacterized protein n=1 Tax=Oryzias melastigma TaxID=30732 RepID=A0A834BYH9_ORYME|nr:hypothetical protein FQA47_017773 [Oryzias melastigma]
MPARAACYCRLLHERTHGAVVITQSRRTPPSDHQVTARSGGFICTVVVLHPSTSSDSQRPELPQHRSPPPPPSPPQHPLIRSGTLTAQHTRKISGDSASPPARAPMLMSLSSACTVLVVKQ